MTGETRPARRGLEESPRTQVPTENLGHPPRTPRLDNIMRTNADWSALHAGICQGTCRSPWWASSHPFPSCKPKLELEGCNGGLLHSAANSATCESCGNGNS